jgi:hypothetical protein
MIKWMVDGQRPDFFEQMIALAFLVWKPLEQFLIDSLIESMPSCR